MTKRIAICISGQARSVQAGYEYMKKHLIEPYSNDENLMEFFIHTWNNYRSMPPYVEECYGSLGEAYAIGQYEKPLKKDFINTRYPRIDNPAYPAFNTYSMLYSIFQANHLKKCWEDEHGFKFDVVVRTRFDYAINKVIDFKEMKDGVVYVPDCRMTPNKDFASDMFAYGTSEVMDLYSNTYANIDHLYKHGVTMNGEHMLSANLRAYGLVGDNLKYVDMNNPFPPGPYNGNWHSIIRDDFDKYKAEGR